MNIQLFSSISWTLYWILGLMTHCVLVLIGFHPHVHVPHMIPRPHVHMILCLGCPQVHVGQAFLVLCVHVFHCLIVTKFN